MHQSVWRQRLVWINKQLHINGTNCSTHFHASCWGLWVSSQGCWQPSQGPLGLVGDSRGASIWDFPHDPLITPMLLQWSHVLLAFLSCSAAAFSGQKESAHTGSLTLPVAKTRSGAEEPTLTLSLCRTMALHGLSHECYQGKHLTRQTKAQKNAMETVYLTSCSPFIREKVKKKQKPKKLHAEHQVSVTVTRQQTQSSFTQWSLHNAQWRTLTNCTLCTLLVLAFYCLQMEPGWQSFFTNLL